MNKRTKAKLRTLIFLFALAFLSSCSDGDRVQPVESGDTPVENEFIVAISNEYSTALNSEVDVLQIKDWDERQAKLIESVRKTIDERLSAHKIKYEIFGVTDVCFLIRSIDHVSKEELLQALAGPEIVDVSNNFIRGAPLINCTLSGTPSQELQWDVMRVSSTSKPNGQYKAAWVVDTGIGTNDDLYVDTAYSRNFVSGQPPGNISDVSCHGTHVAGIIGAKADGNGIVGVAPNAPIRAIKVYPNDQGVDFAGYLLGLKFILDNGTAGEVVNISMNPGAKDLREIDLLTRIAQKGLKITLAAGNSGLDVDAAQLYPAALNVTGIYTVSSFRQGNSLAANSNYGLSVDYSQPGVNIVSTFPGKKYGTLSGTSQAAPHLAGLFLLGQPRNDGTILGDKDNKPDPIAHEQ